MRTLLTFIQVRIQNANSEETFCITAYTSPVIYSPLPRLVDASINGHLEGLQLADANDSAQGIDVLIGSDHYWSVVTGEMIVGDNGSVAVGSPRLPTNLLNASKNESVLQEQVSSK